MPAEAEALVPQTPSPLAERPAFRGAVMLRDRFQIDPSKPLEGLDTVSAKAFGVADRMETGRELFALIGTPGLPPRIDVLTLLKGTSVRGALMPVDAGPIEWPLLGQRCLAVVYDRPLGGRFADVYTPTGSRLGELDLLLRRLIRPAAAALKHIAQRKVTHRSIRPKNLYFIDKDQQSLVLGDCITVPAGFDQPAVFETIERAMASQGGRGEGTPSDDLYALGVTILIALLGKNPVADMGDADLIRSRIERGSYATLCTDQPVPLSLLEPLRGLLADSEEERWQLADLEAWMDGRRTSLTPRRPQLKAEIPLLMAEKEYTNKRVLAYAMTLDRPVAAAAIRDGGLDQWLRRMPSETTLADAIIATLADVKFQEVSGPHADDFLVAKVAILLDPTAPIRYKDIAFMPEAVGTTIAVEMLRRGHADVVKETILQHIPAIWFAAQDSAIKARTVNVASIYEDLEAILQHPGIGYGMERCLYGLNPSLPCLSPLLIREYATNIKDMMHFLDDVAKRVDNKTRPMDRDIAAFIAARAGGEIAPHLAALGDADEKKATIGMLSILAMLQSQHETGSLYGLASWVGGLLGPAINTYHNRSTRRALEQEIPRLVRRGSLPDMFSLIDNAARRQHDGNGFTVAVAQYAAAQAEVVRIESADTSKSETAELIGQQWASTFAILSAMMILTVILLIETL